MPDGVFHEIPATLAEGCRHLAIIHNHFRRARKTPVEMNRRIALGRFRQHILVDPLKAGELGEVAAAALHCLPIVLRRERIGRLQFLAVKIELLLCELHALGIHVASGRPVPHQHGSQELPRALVVMRSGNQVRFERLVSRAILVTRTGRRGQALQAGKQPSLGLREQQLMELGEVHAANLGIQIAARVQPPAQAPGRAFALIVPQHGKRLAQGLQALQGIERWQVQAARLRGGNAACSFDGLGFEGAVARPRNQETGGENQT